MLCALIMAGGEGTRFWPCSTKEKPKQFVNIFENKTMIQLTIERICKLIPLDKVFISTNEKYKKILIEQVPDLPPKNIILEPIGRNTAPSILLASLIIRKIYVNANIIVVPSDHLIGKIDKFLQSVNIANKFIEKNTESIITFGIKPNRAETNYGYINVDTIIENEITKVNKFLEKPTMKTAEEFLNQGNYLWNAGIFVFNIGFIINEFKEKLNDTYNILLDLIQLDNEEYELKLQENYKKCENISIDYAIMEKSKNIYTIPCNFDWDDIGTWSAIKRYIKPDNNNNYIKGNGFMCDANNNIIFSREKKIIMMNVSNLFCIESDDVIIVGNQEQIEEIKEYKNRFNL